MSETKYYLLRKDVAFKDSHEFKYKSILEKYNDEDYIYIEQDGEGLTTIVYFYDKNNTPCQVLDSIDNEHEVNYLWNSCIEYYLHENESLDELRKRAAFENFPFFFFHSSDGKMKTEFQYLVQRAKNAIAGNTTNQQL